jgi:hypothetical protein
VRERGESSLHYSLPVFDGRWKRQAPKLRDNLELRERSSYQTRLWCERERGKEGGERARLVEIEKDISDCDNLLPIVPPNIIHLKQERRQI